MRFLFCLTLYVLLIIGNSSIALAQSSPPNTQYVACDISGSTDCSSTLQSALNSLNSNGGGHAVLPAGTINLSAEVQTYGGIWISGQGWQDYSGTFGQHTSGAQRGVNGTYIYTNNTATSPIICGSAGYVGGQQCRITDLAFTESQPSDAPGWSPISHQPSILFLGNSISLENILFWGVNEGLQSGIPTQTSGFAGRVLARHIFGACFTWCFNEESVSDVNVLEDLHIYSYFLDGNPNQIAWILAHAIGIRMARSDAPFLSNIFIYGNAFGLYLTINSNGVTSALHGQNFYCDGCPTGLLIDGNGTTASFTNFFTQTDWNGKTGTANSININVPAMNVQLDMVNTNLNHALAYAGSFTGAGSDISFTNLRLGDYDINNGGYVGISAASGVNLGISGRFMAVSANSTAATGGTGTFHTGSSY